MKAPKNGSLSTLLALETDSSNGWQWKQKVPVPTAKPSVGENDLLLILLKTEIAKRVLPGAWKWGWFLPSKPSLRYHFLPHSLIPLSFSNAIYPPMTFWALTPLSLSLILRCLFPPLTAILPELLLEWGHSFCLEHLSAHARKIISCFLFDILTCPK